MGSFGLAASSAPELILARLSPIFLSVFVGCGSVALCFLRHSTFDIHHFPTSALIAFGSFPRAPICCRTALDRTVTKPAQVTKFQDVEGVSTLRNDADGVCRGEHQAVGVLDADSSATMLDKFKGPERRFVKGFPYSCCRHIRAFLCRSSAHFETSSKYMMSVDLSMHWLPALGFSSFGLPSSFVTRHSSSG